MTCVWAVVGSRYQTVYQSATLLRESCQTHLAELYLVVVAL